MKPLFIEQKEIALAGIFPRVATLRAEYFEWLASAAKAIEELKRSGASADIFSFLQPVTDRTPRYDYRMEWDSISAVPVTTYEQWWKKQINDKTRNMVRKAQKKGVELRTAEFNDELVRGIEVIYNDSPMRQGKPFKHYGKRFETLKADHISFLDRSQFVGAYFEGELIGFIKIVRDDGIWHLMQIISMIKHRDKAPTNALIAKAVELCAQNHVPYLHYGVWSRRGLGDFKKHHAFERLDLPRYFVPLTGKGRLALSLGLHRKLTEHLPDSLQDVLANVRAKWTSYKYRTAAT
jgi:hypothetical protein